MKPANLVLVRPDPERADRNHPVDRALAERLAAHPPCWVVLLGGTSRPAGAPPQQAWATRRDRLRGALGVAGIAERGVSVFAPTALAGAPDADALATQLAQYLGDVGLRMPLKRSSRVDLRLPADLDPVLLAAAVEAAAVHPRVDVLLGERRLKSRLRWELRRDMFRAPRATPHAALIGSTPAIEKVRQKVDRYAEQPFPVLLIGETGTGKEVVANMLHERSARDGRFMAQNAAQLPLELADSLLFGHRKGAFTGADTDRPGRIREAQGGTFFLDEAFNLAPAVQGKLLRALNRVEEGVILVESVGETKPPSVVHARLVVSALSDPRVERTGEGLGRMRADLFYRVSAGIIRLPPLRQTLDDLPALCAGLLSQIRPDVQVSQDAIGALREHDWPGNIRELRLILLRSLMDARKGTTTLDADQVRKALDTNRLPPGARALPLPCNLDLELKRIEVATLQAAMREVGHVKSKAGLRIGMDPKTRHNFGRRLDAAEQQLTAMEGAERGDDDVR